MQLGPRVIDDTIYTKFLYQTAALFEVASHHVEETCDQQLVSIASTALSVMRNLPRNTLPLLSTAHPQTSSLVLQPTSQASPTLVVPSMLPTSSVHEHAVTVQPTVSTLVVPSSHALLNVPLMDDVTTAIRCSEPWPEQSKTLPPLTPYTVSSKAHASLHSNTRPIIIDHGNVARGYSIRAPLHGYVCICRV